MILVYEDGQDFPFDGGVNDFCREFTDDQGNPYYKDFIDVIDIGSYSVH
jgi:hypothetical protein